MRCAACHGPLLVEWGEPPVCLCCGRVPGAAPMVALPETRRPTRYRRSELPRVVHGGIRPDGRLGRPTKAERAAWDAGMGVHG